MAAPDAYKGDLVTYNGMDVHYNGPDTIAQKTLYAVENLGGIMIWELTQDTTAADKSLLQAIGKAIAPCSTVREAGVGSLPARQGRAKIRAWHTALRTGDRRGITISLLP